MKGSHAVTCSQDIAWLLRLPASNVQDGQQRPGSSPTSLPTLPAGF